MTAAELEAWWDARRSLLYNEVCLTLTRFQNTVIGYLTLTVISLGIEAIRTAVLKQPLHTMLFPAGIIMLFLSYMMLNAAMRCDSEQKKHVHLLECLQTNLKGDANERDRMRRVLGDRIAMLEKSDFQTRLFFFPLNRNVVCALTGYFATSGAAIFYGVLSNQDS